MKKPMKFPKTVCVRIVKDHKTAPWLMAHERIEEVIDDNGPSIIGVYHFSRTVTALKSVSVTEHKKAET